jgi:hypothetical protein
MYAIRWTGSEPSESGSSPTSGSLRWATTQDLVSEENLTGPATSPDRRRFGESLAPRARFAIPALRGIAAPRSPARWRHWIVVIDALGRVT